MNVTPTSVGPLVSEPDPGAPRLGGKRSARRSAIALLGAIGFTGLFALAAAPQAQASRSCVPGWCSETINETNLPVTVYRDWTCSGGGTGTTSTACVDLKTADTLGAYSGTDSTQDWDAFQVDAGWCYTVTFDGVGGTRHTYYDRVGLGNLHVKISNVDTAHITGQWHGHCPV